MLVRERPCHAPSYLPSLAPAALVDHENPRIYPQDDPRYVQLRVRLRAMRIVPRTRPVPLCTRLAEVHGYHDDREDRDGTMTPGTFGQRLRDARRAAGLTQEVLAEQAGVSVRAIQALERGRNRPHRDTAGRLATALTLGAGEHALFTAAAAPAPRHRSAGRTEAARELAPPPTNVLPRTTSFVGRTREMTEVAAALTGTQLLTLVGTGGVGKTRLALQVADAVRLRYPQGAWLVALAHVADPTLVPRAVASALSLRLSDDSISGLTAALRDQRLLLILDNCEHMLDASARLADALLAACPSVQVLTTSREPLMVAGEALWPVPPLTLPEGEGHANLDRAERSEAVRLFVERAAAQQPGFALRAANVASVVEICRRLDGIPLALELAAARTRSLGVDQLVAHLDRRFGLLTAGLRTALPRQQTLRAMVDWSYDLLTEQERTLFARLSVFAGVFTIDAVEAVCAEEQWPAESMLIPLVRLVDKSLVMVDEGEVVAYRLLDTLRHYGWERLGERGEQRGLRARHAAYYRGLAEQAEPELFKGAQAVWYERLDDALDNIRAALAWYLGEAESVGDSAAASAGLGLASALWWFWLVRQHRREGMAWLERALRRQTEPSLGRAKALLGLGSLTCLGSTPSDQARGQALLDEGVVVARAADDRRILVYLLIFYGGYLRDGRGWEHHWARNAADDVRGIALLGEGVRLAREVGDAVLVAHALCGLAYNSDLESDVERGRARAAATESLVLSTQVGDLYRVAMAQRVLGRIAQHEGDLAQASTAFSAELAIMRTLGDRAGLALALSNLGAVAQAAGDRASARMSYEQSVAAYHEIDYDRDLLARALRCLDDLALTQDDTA